MLSLTGARHPGIAADADGRHTAAGREATWILRLEGAVVLVAALSAYAALGGAWWLFAALFLAPDIGMAAYAFGPRRGAWGYNTLHTYLAPAALVAVGLAGVPAVLPVAAIWVAHIGFDRALGYGLKLPEGFGHTHLGRVGR